MRSLPTLAAALLMVSACSSSGTLTYVPTGPVTPARAAVVGGVAVTDARNEKPNRIATVRGGYGNPFYVRDLERPVSEEVATVFNAALRQRGLLAQGPAPFRMAVTVRKLDGNQYVTRNAGIDMELTVSDAGGRVLYRDAVKDERTQFEFFSQSIDKLQALVGDLLNTSVDRLLDKPGLRAALDRPGS